MPFKTPFDIIRRLTENRSENTGINADEYETIEVEDYETIELEEKGLMPYY